MGSTGSTVLAGYTVTVVGVTRAYTMVGSIHVPVEVVLAMADTIESAKRRRRTSWEAIVLGESDRVIVSNAVFEALDVKRSSKSEPADTVFKV